MEQLCFPLFLSLSSEIEVDVLLENYEIAAQNVVCIHCLPQLQLVAWKNFEREVNTFPNKSFFTTNQQDWLRYFSETSGIRWLAFTFDCMTLW